MYCADTAVLINSGQYNEPPARNDVLIVEDEMLVADDLAETLQQLGYGVAGYARDVDEAIQKAEETKPDLVLMDINLGSERDGVSAANVIRERWNLPVVFVTAYASPEIVERAKAAGPYGFLTKPVGLRELDATLGIAIQQQSRARGRPISGRSCSSRSATRTLRSATPGRSCKRYHITSFPCRTMSAGASPASCMMIWDNSLHCWDSSCRSLKAKSTRSLRLKWNHSAVMLGI